LLGIGEKMGVYWNNTSVIDSEKDYDSVKREVLYNILTEFGISMKILTDGKPEGKRSLGRPRHRWEDNIRMYLSEIGWRGVDWILLVQDRDQWQVLVNIVLNLRVP
jgi:hypothetical protein